MTGPVGLAGLVAATPEDRDRVVDFLRAASILAVVLGHWMIATVVEVDGERQGTNALAALDWLRPLTWAFQVMPVFFLVGGFANLRSLHAGADGRADAGGFLARRADRLLRPTLVFVGVWLVVAAWLERRADPSDLVRDITRIAAQPLWFLAVFVMVVLAAPLQLRAHRARPSLTLAGLAGLVVLLDVLRLNDWLAGAAVVNYLAVFLFAQGMGFAYADGRFDSVPPRRALAVGALALAVLVALTTVGPYPVSMIGLPGQRISNMSPPTVCVLVLGVAQAALLLAVRRPLGAWLQRPRVWRTTIVVNVVVLTVFLWHLTAFMVTGAVLLALGLPVVEVGTGAWWLQKALTVAVSTVVLISLVVVFGPLERWTVAPRAPRHLATRAIGAALAVVGLAGIALAGFDKAFEVGGRALLGLRLSPAVAALTLAVGWVLARSPAER